MGVSFDLVIVNGRIVTAGDIGSYCIGVKDGLIRTLAPSFTAEEMEGAEIIDAEGGYVMPGGIDCHVHLCQDLQSGPHGLGGRCADDFETGSLSALCGGTTTMINFAAQTRSEDDRSLLGVVDRYDQRAQATGSYIDYSYHMIIVRDDPDVLQAELPVLMDRGISSCKLFMTYETMRLQDKELLDVMMEARKVGMTTLIHAENGDMVEWLTDKLEAKGWVEPYYHALSRPPLVEFEATQRAISLSELIDNPILFVHIGSAIAMENVRRAQTRGLPVYAETCPQYLNLTWEDLRKFHSPTCFENSKMVCSPPPPPNESDQDALYLGLHNGTFTIFSSDHCPFRYGDDVHGKASGIFEADESLQAPKGDPEALSQVMQKEKGKFRFVPNGIPGVETRLPLLYTGGLQTGRISPQRFVEVTSTNPAKLYGLYPRKGAIMPGSDADFTIWYPDHSFTPFTLSNTMLHHNVDYTPYEGKTFGNWPRYTILRGDVLYANGEVKAKSRGGQFVKRGPNQLSKDTPRNPKAKQDPRRVANWLYDKL